MARKRDLASAVHSAGREPARVPEQTDVARTSAGSEPEGAPQGQTRGYRPPSRAGTKAVVIHVEPSLSKSIRRLALEMDTTVQALGLEALEDLLRKHLAK